MRLAIHTDKFALGLTLSVYRRWKHDQDWTDNPTYAYAGFCLNRPLYWLHGRVRFARPRFGRHVDQAGRVYLYLAYVTLFQDMFPG